MSRLETVDRYCILATLDVNGEIFISALENWVWSIIWWLKGFANGVMPDEDMGGC